MWFGCFLWLKIFVSAIDFCLFHLCRWAVVWPTGWLIYSYPDISIHIILIASTYSSLSILCSMIFFILHLYRIKIFFREMFFYVNSSCNKSNDSKLQIEWHYFGLFKVLLKLSTNSKHSARLSVSFWVRKSTVPNSVLDIFVNLVFLAVLKALYLHSRRTE